MNFLRKFLGLFILSLVFIVNQTSGVNIIFIQAVDKPNETTGEVEKIENIFVFNNGSFQDFINEHLAQDGIYAIPNSRCFSREDVEELVRLFDLPCIVDKFFNSLKKIDLKRFFKSILFWNIRLPRHLEPNLRPFLNKLESIVRQPDEVEHGIMRNTFPKCLLQPSGSGDAAQTSLPSLERRRPSCPYSFEAPQVLREIDRGGIGFINNQDFVKCVAMSGDGSCVAVRYLEESIKILVKEDDDKFALKQVLVNKQGGNLVVINSLSMSENGNYLFVGSNDSTIRIYRKNEYGVFALFQILDFLVNGHTDSVSSVAISADGNYLVSGSLDCTIKLWNLQGNGRFCLIETLNEGADSHDAWISSVTITANGDCIVSRAIDGSVKVWLKAATGGFEFSQDLAARVAAGEDEFVTAVGVSLNGDCIILGYYNGMLEVFRKALGNHFRLAQRLGQSLCGHSKLITSISISSNNNMISASADCKLKLWATATNEDFVCMQTLGCSDPGRECPFLVALISADGKSLISQSCNNKVVLWQRSMARGGINRDLFMGPPLSHVEATVLPHGLLPSASPGASSDTSSQSSSLEHTHDESSLPTFDSASVDVTTSPLGIVVKSPVPQRGCSRVPPAKPISLSETNLASLASGPSATTSTSVAVLLQPGRISTTDSLRTCSSLRAGLINRHILPTAARPALLVPVYTQRAISPPFRLPQVSTATAAPASAAESVRDSLRTPPPADVTSLGSLPFLPPSASPSFAVAPRARTPELNRGENPTGLPPLRMSCPNFSRTSGTLPGSKKG